MITTYAGVGQRTTVYAAAVFLEHAEPQKVFSLFGETKPMPKNKAETIKFRRSVPFPKLVVELAEGVTPTSRQIIWEDVSATMQEWGDVVEASDRIRELSEDPVIQEASKLLGEQATETTEGIIFGVVKAGTQVGFANGVASRLLTVTRFTLNDIHAAVRALARQRAKFVTEIQSGSVNYATSPIEAGYIAFGHTDLEHDIRALAGFVPVAKYGSRKPLSTYELGSVENIRFILSVVCEPWAAATTASTAGFMPAGTSSPNDVYPLIIIARGAYAQVPLKGSKAVEMFVWTGGDKSDPLNQRDVVGAKYWFTAARLNENWMYRIETLATKL